MTAPKRFLVIYIFGWLIVLGLACYALGNLLVSLVWWRFQSCGPAPQCGAVAWFLEYWWLPFFVFVMAYAYLCSGLVEWLINRLRARLKRAEAEDRGAEAAE